MTTPEEKSKNLLWKALLPMVAILGIVTGGLYWVKSQVALLPKEAVQNQSSNPDLTHLELTEFGGSKRKISELKPKVLMFNFWASWCEACMVEMPSIVALRKNYVNRGFEVLPINVDEKPESILPKLLKKFGIDFPVYVDPEGKLADVFDLRAIPLTVIVDQNRKVLMTLSGEYDWNNKEIHSKIENWLSQ